MPVKKVAHNHKEIIYIDYSNLKEKEMISLLLTARDLVLQCNQKTRVLSILENNYITPQLLKHVEQALKSTEHLIEKNAVIGLTEIQTWILKGINLWYGVKLHHFKSEGEALDFLAGDNHSNN